MTAQVQTDGRLAVGGVDLVELADRVRDAPVRLRRGPPAAALPARPWPLGRRCRLCDQGVPVPGDGQARPTKRGCGSTSPPAGSCTWHSPPACPRRASCSTATTSPRTSWPRALECGVGRIVVDSFDEIERLARLTRNADGRRRSPWRDGPGDPRGGGAHPRLRAHGPGGLEVRLRLASGAAAEAVARLARLPGVDLVGIHAHIGSQVFRRRRPSQQEVEVLAGFFAPSACTNCAWGAAWASRTWPGSAALPSGEWARTTVHDACGTPGSRRHPGHRRARPVDRRRRRASRCTGWGPSRTLPGCPHLRGRRRGHERQSPPRALRQRIRDLPPPRAGRAAAPGGQGGGKALRVRRRHGGRGARLPADLAVGDVLATPVTGAYGYSMASNYNKVPRPAVVFVSGGDARLVVRRESLRRPDPARRMSHRDAVVPFAGPSAGR